jgi:hypothetical protein
MPVGMKMLRDFEDVLPNMLVGNPGRYVLPLAPYH